MKFEESVVRGFLHALGWSIYDRNLKEQVSKYNGKDRTDFFLHSQGNEKETQIIVELKRPEHKQKQKDVEQIERYMKVYGCRFGIYIGEKMEVFYRLPKGDDFVAVSVTTIEYHPNNPAAEQLLVLLKHSNYDKDKLDKYCTEHLEVNKYAQEWKTSEGKDILYQAIIEKCNLSPVIASRLRSILTFNINDNIENIKSETIVVPDSKPATTLPADRKVWLICYDSNYFKVADCFEKYGKIFWRHKNNLVNVHKGDVAYLYASTPDSAVRFKVEVVDSQLPYTSEMDEGDEFSNSNNPDNDAAEYKYFLVRPIGETHSPALRHKALMDEGLMGKRPSTTILSKDKFKDLKQFIEQHFNDTTDYTEPVVVVSKNKPKSNFKKQTKSQEGKKRRPPFRFHMIGMTPGTVLTFTLANIQVTVAGDDVVEFQGKKYMLSQFCQVFDPKEGSENQQYQGPAYFLYKGKTLARLRDEKEGLVPKKLVEKI